MPFYTQFQKVKFNSPVLLGIKELFMLLWDNKSQTPERTPASQGGAGHSKKTVELFVVRVGDQPFGLLLKQIFNIARPEGDLFSAIQSPDPEKRCSEILYQGKILQVVELARK